MKHLSRLTALILCLSLIISTAAHGAETVTSPDTSGTVSESSTTDHGNPETSPYSETESGETAETNRPEETTAPGGTSESETANQSETTNESETAGESETTNESETASESGTTNESETAGESEKPEDSSESEESEEVPEENLDAPSDENDLVRAFVKRLYTTLLLREPDEKGLSEWTAVLKKGSSTGADIIGGFIFSDEFKKNNYSDEKFVELMYHALFDREPDEAGFNAWVGLLDEMFSRNYVFAGFVGSDEFHRLCSKYQIRPGTVALTNVVDQNTKVTHFVNYLYEYILSRKCDYKGLTGWVSQLVNRRNTAAEVVYGFVFSKEFQNKNLPDRDYVAVLYKTILDRSPDGQGFEDWCAVLENGGSRLNVLHGFIESTEFKKLCDSYQITAGTIQLTEARDMNNTLTKYIMLCHKNCFGRRATADELNNWCTKLSGGTSPGTFLESILFSSESNPGGLSSDAFVKRVFQTVLHRAPSSQELNSGVNRLSQTSRKNYMMEVVQSPEGRQLLAKYGLKEERYQNPAGYYQIKDYIAPLGGGGYELNREGYEGLKVAWVIKKLGVNNGNYVGMNTKARYGPQTISAVRNFQQRNRLKVDGIVGLNTWKAMGYSENDWYNLGTYVSPLLTNASSSRSDHIEAMIQTAYKYLGDPYVVGASGRPGQGVDCSGLMMQALYSAGIDMETITPVTHSMPGHEYESANMWASSKFKHVPYSQRQRGDLIFYQNAYGSIIHVALYLGNDQVIEAWPNKVVVWPVKNNQRSNIAGVARPFI